MHFIATLTDVDSDRNKGNKKQKTKHPQYPRQV